MKHTEKFLQRRKFYMALPILALPFITMIFWALGGGQGTPVQAMTTDNPGLNPALPSAQFEEEREDEIWDKLKLYESAARDSAEYETARENDPYFDLIAFQSGQDKQTDDKSKLIGTFKHRDKLATDPNEEKVTNKLEQLYQEINRTSRSQDVNAFKEPERISDDQFTDDVSKLEQMMEQMHSEEGGDTDPEMKEINSMLEKLMDIQHPERVKDRMLESLRQNKAASFTVKPVQKQDVSILNTIVKHPVSDTTNQIEIDVQPQFFGVTDEVISEQPVGNAIEAIIHETQQLVSGSTVRMRLIKEVTINGKIIPENQFIYGTCSINGERLMIQVTSIRNENLLLPVSLAVYDLDGLEGLYIPGAITRDAAKQASDDALQNVQLLSMDTSLGAQAASAGIEATKGLLSKKVKLIKVIVKAGYNILLQDNTQK